MHGDKRLVLGYTVCFLVCIVTDIIFRTTAEEGCLVPVGSYASLTAFIR